jgi:hypothetical protein
MQIRRMLARLAELAIAGLFMIGCVPLSLPGPTATAGPTETVAPTTAATTTNTPTLQPTTTETLPPSLTPDPYAVDTKKLFNNLPANAAEFAAGVANGKYVQSPSLISDKAAFDKWVTEQLAPALGDLNNLPASMEIYTMGREPYTIYFEGPDLGIPISMIGTPEFFYFTENNGSTIYPVMIFKFALSGGRPLDVNIGIEVVTLMNTNGTPQLNVFENLSVGKKIDTIAVDSGVLNSRSAIINELITSGVNGYYQISGLKIGVGRINFLE